MQGKSQFHEVYIVAGQRTPIGSLNGKLSKFSGPKLGALAIRGALQSIDLDPKLVSEVILGNVCSAGLGQNPARQAALEAGIPQDVPVTNINKVCASGLKAIMLGAQSIALGQSEVVVAGGFQSMSNIPHYITNGNSFGHETMLDGMMYDGLTDKYTGKPMGYWAQQTARDFKITREENDQFCVNSYEQTLSAQVKNKFDFQVTPVRLDDNTVLKQDQEPNRFQKDKIGQLQPAFIPETGTITAANASKINDGGCALILMSDDAIKKLNIKPLARIVSYADAEVDPEDFCISPSVSGEKALKFGGLQLKDMGAFEFNEAFSTTVLANIKKLKVDEDQVNIHGGAVALGHPLGMSGARIVLSLINVLKSNKLSTKFGMAGICNGGGGGSSIIIELTN